MFSISTIPLENLNLRADIYDDAAGAFTLFEGWVRNHNQGKAVITLEYEAYESLCVREANKIIQETKKRFDIINVRCSHRIGKLNIGEMAVWIGVTSAHRDPAFQACRYLIDEIKHRLPIWKKEYYANGDSGWVACACATPALAEDS